MDRRSFLRGATVVGSGLIAGGVAAACSSSSTHSSNAGGGTTSTTQTDQGPPDWSKLAASLVGPLLQPGDSGYAAAGHLYNAVYTPNAAAIAQCGPVSDVQRCLAFAREHNMQVAARSGGHSYGGYSSCPGLVIDVSSMDAISVGGAAGPNQTLVTVGSGNELIDVYSTLAAHNLLLPGGSCPSVGIAGLALGGGVGVFSRAYGLTCDQLTDVEIVTADGVLHRSGPDGTRTSTGPAVVEVEEISASSPRSDSGPIPFPRPSPSSRSSGRGEPPTGFSMRGFGGSRRRRTSCGPTANSSAVGRSEVVSSR